VTPLQGLRDRVPPEEARSADDQEFHGAHCIAGRRKGSPVDCANRWLIRSTTREMR
jgi:hypothetical protein